MKSRVVLLRVGDHERHEGCATCSLFKMCLPSNFNGREIQLFENIVAGRRRDPRHASLYCQNDPFQMLYAIRYGQFKLIGAGRTGEIRVAGFHMAGDLVGMDGIALGHHSFRMMALENSEVCEIPYAALARVMSVEPTMQREFLRAMSTAIFAEHEHSRMLSVSSLDERFANFLMNYGASYSRLGYSDKAFRLSMSRGDLGSYLGTTVESISRLIKRFNAQGSVSITGREVRLHDVNYLRALSAGDDKALTLAISQQDDARLARAAGAHSS